MQTAHEITDARAASDAEQPQATFAFNDEVAAETYDRLLLPIFFNACAAILINRAAPVTGEAVLDVATGPGTVAHQVARIVGPRGRVVGVDVSRPMLERAEAHPTGAASAPITWIESPAAPLAVQSGEFDLALCQQGFQFFPEPANAASEIARALRPGGRVGVAVWEGIEKCTAFAALRRALGLAGFPELAESILKPFSWPSSELLTSTLQKAGFVPDAVTSHAIPVCYPGGVADVFESLWAGPIGAELDRLGAPARALVLRKLTEETRSLRGPNDAVSAEMVTKIIFARKPG